MPCPSDSYTGASSELADEHHKSVNLVLYALGLRYVYFYIRRDSAATTSRRYLLPIEYRVSAYALDVFTKAFLDGCAAFDITHADLFPAKMSVVYEPRNFLHEGSYPPIGDPSDHDHSDTDRFVDPDVSELAAVAAGSYNHAAPLLSDPEPRLDMPSVSLKEDSPLPATPQRIRAVPKPDREVTKNVDGKYCCTWPGCIEDVKEFGRKCEWR